MRGLHKTMRTILPILVVGEPIWIAYRATKKAWVKVETLNLLQPYGTGTPVMVGLKNALALDTMRGLNGIHH